MHFEIESRAEEEPVPLYEKEIEGMQALKSVLQFVSDNEYYPTFDEKCAYIMCSIAGAQHFSNGNKRLSIGLLLIFLIINKAQVLDITKEYAREIVTKEFKGYKWDPNSQITGNHALLLYNLAIAIGSRNDLGIQDFSILKEKVRSIFKVIYRL